MKRFVAVAGNIGVGKSTLVERLAEKLGWEPFYEPVGDNPYLADFYDDMQTWGFHSQIFFLTRRLRMHRMLTEHATSAIQDRTVYEDAEVFAYNLSIQGHISDRDFETYRELYQVLTSFLPAPDLVVYLKAGVQTLQDRIATRGRDYERAIPEAYLRRLNDLYDAWIDRFTLCPVLTVPADDLNYATNQTHLALIVDKINDKLAGKDEVVFGAEEVARVNGA
jgi:deoxyadenosine/deoxycytidine kinase